MQHQNYPFGYSLARLLKILTVPESGMFVFVPLLFVLAIDRGASVTTVMAACLPQTVVSFPFAFPFTTGAFWAPAIVHALANMIAVEIRNFFENIFFAGIFVANTLVENIFF